MAEQNIEELLEILNLSENMMRFNASIEKDIKKHGGTVIYSYNNLIIATEIDDNLFAELKKNPFIEYIEDLPMKRYGDIDKTLIDQLDISKINIILSGSTTKEKVIDPVTVNQSGSTTPPNVNTNTPIISNTNFYLTAVTNQWFEYYVTATGNQPINFSIKPQIHGPISIEGNLIKGFSGIEGVATIEITATNNYGVDTKVLTVTSYNAPKITSPLVVYGTQNAAFNYNIADTGASYSYRCYGLPSGLTLSGYIISGTLFCTSGVYKPKIVIESPISSVSADLEIRVASSGGTQKPVITSNDGVGDLNEYFEYTITATGPGPITYSITGSLPDKLKFATNKITGPANESGIYPITLKATNFNGTTTKGINIIINDDEPTVPHP